MSEPRLLLSPLAETDLADIGSYIAEDNPKRAETFVLEFLEFLEKVAANPYLGRPREELRKGLRSLPFSGYSYVIYYRVLARRSGIKVERILHGARDISRLM